jgi:hypothetical protein
MMWHPDSRPVFFFTVSPLEIVVRATLMYLSPFVLLRLILKRQTSTFSTADGGIPTASSGPTVGV